MKSTSRAFFVGLVVVALGACEVGDPEEAAVWEALEYAQDSNDGVNTTQSELAPVIDEPVDEPIDPNATTSNWKSLGYLGSCEAGPAGPLLPIHLVSCTCEQLTKTCAESSCTNSQPPQVQECASTSYLRGGSPFYLGCRLTDLDYCEDFCAGASSCDNECSSADDGVVAQTNPIEVAPQ